MAVLLERIPTISQGDVDSIAIDGRPYLDAGETFTGDPTAAESGKITSYDSDGIPTITASADLSLTSVAVNDQSIVINGATVGVGLALQCMISGQKSGNVYAVLFTATTSAGRTKKVIARVKVV